jgi:RNA polymerase sigma-70 factor (sigma-E family)
MDSFEDYVRARGSTLLGMAHLLTGDRHLAEDVLQEALGHALRKWSRVSSADARDAAVRRLLVDEFLTRNRRRERTELVLTDPVPGRTGPTVPAGREAVDPGGRLPATDEAWRLLAELPARQRAVLVLRYWSDLADVEIADLLGCAQATVRSSALRGLTHLRSAIPTDDTEATR